MSAYQLSAVQAAQAIREGSLTSRELVEACLARIDEVEDVVQAWAYLDREGALAQADAADQYRSTGGQLGPLHGVPVGIKDIVDTKDMPTENGTVLHAGRQPAEDATVIGLLREAGAIIMGKTVTTELAVMSPGKTANPHNPDHTPGGSSSGSAAAVAAGMVPLAIGSQTNGSTIRPAAYCGVFGYKPTFGRISRNGVLHQSTPLDTVGVFARALEDMALLGDVLISYDSRDASMTPLPKPGLMEKYAEDMPVQPHIAFVRTPAWDQAEDTTKDAFRELVDFMNEDAAIVDLIELPSSLDTIYDNHAKIMNHDLAENFGGEYAEGKDRLSDVLCKMIEDGQAVSEADYAEALKFREHANVVLNKILEDYDAILTPSVPGEAPHGLDATGSPVFCTIWTMTGTPAINLPVLQGPNGLPLGAQLVSHRNDDGRLFRTARWFLEKLTPEDED